MQKTETVEVEICGIKFQVTYKFSYCESDDCSPGGYTLYYEDIQIIDGFENFYDFFNRYTNLDFNTELKDKILELES